MYPGVILALAIASPQPTPLKTIVHIRTSPFCTTLRENVKPAIAGLLLNNDLIAGAAPVFTQMAEDSVAGGPAVEMENQHLRRIGYSLVHNLQTIDNFLADAKRFPNDASADGGELTNIKSQLLAAAQEQKKALNLIFGVAETHAMESMPSEIGLAGSGISAAGPEFGSGINTPYFTSLNQPGRFRSAFSSTPVGVPDTATLGAGAGTFGSPYRTFHDALLLQARAILTKENIAGDTVGADAAGCR